MEILYVIPELIIVAIIFGTWKMVYEKEQLLKSEKYRSTEDSVGLMVIATICSVAGVGAMIGIAALANQ